MKKLSKMVIGGALTMSAFASGCGTDSGSEADPAVEVSAEQPKLVASVQLSPTHTIAFWDHGDGQGQIEESLHADLDRAAPLTLARMKMDGRPLAQIYTIFAADKADPAVISRLDGMDRLALQSVLAHPPAGALVTPLLHVNAGASPVPAAAPSDPVATAGTPESVESRRSAATCSEPNVDWTGDATWFRDNFCNDLFNNWLCDANHFGWESWGWYGWLNYFKAQDFNQSFCVTNQFIVKARTHSLGGSTERTLFNKNDIPTRFVWASAWNATGKTEFYAKVTSSSRFGFAIDQNETFFH